MASVIEMGLLNCTHVIAVITPNPKGTMWIPYGYGRVKEPPPVTLQAACWLHRDYTDDLAEYLQLGPVHHQECDILSSLTPSPFQSPKPGCNPTKWGATSVPLVPGPHRRHWAGAFRLYRQLEWIVGHSEVGPDLYWEVSDRS